MYIKSNKKKCYVWYCFKKHSKEYIEYDKQSFEAVGYKHMQRRNGQEKQQTKLTVNI